MSNSLFRKGLVLSIVLLLIGIIIVPTITGEFNLSRGLKTESLSNRLNNEELIKIRVIITDEDGAKEHIVMFTQQQSDELDNLIKNFKMDLLNSESIEETTILHCDMVDSVNEFGLFPNDERAARTRS